MAGNGASGLESFDRSEHSEHIECGPYGKDAVSMAAAIWQW